MALYIGIDGGGTKTQAVALDTATMAVVSKRGPGANPNTVGWDKAIQTVFDLMDQVVGDAADEIGHEAVGTVTDAATAGHSALSVKLDGVCVGLAGVDRSAQLQRLAEALHHRLPGVAVEATNDALIGLSAGTGGAPGIILIAGTGSIAYGEAPDGQLARSGGYGPLFGDEGSGFDIGRRGLMAAVQHCEHRGPQTALWDAASRFFDVQKPSELIAKVYDSPHPVAAVASFAQQVVALAGADALAGEIVDRAVADYDALIHSVYRQLSVTAPSPSDTASSRGDTSAADDFGDPVASAAAPSHICDVVLSGGLLTHAPTLANRLMTRQRGSQQNLVWQYHVLHRPAACGAVLRAMRAAHRQAGDGGITSEERAAWERMVDQLSD